MLSQEQIPAEILMKATTVKVKSVGRPPCLSETESSIIEFMEKADEGEVIPFCAFRPSGQVKLPAYKHALRRIQDETTMFAQELKDAGVSVFKKGNKCFLWKLEAA